MKRLFFALWPDDGERARLAQRARLLSIETGRRVPHDNFHITLVFLGNVAEQTIPALTGAAEGISLPGFRLQINHCGWWKRAKVAWLAPACAPEPLLELVRQLNHQARLVGLPVDERDYNPHLTIARKLTHPLKQCTFEPIHMDIRQFCLVESVTHEKGARYRVLQSWGLA